MTLFSPEQSRCTSGRGARGVRRQRRGRHRDRDAGVMLAAGAGLEAAVRIANRAAGIVVGKLGTAVGDAAARACSGNELMYYVVTGAAGFIGSNLVRALNQRGVTNIIAVDNLQHGDKFRNLADCEIADYLDQARIPRQPASGFDGARRGGAAPGRVLRHHGDRRPLHDGEQLRATRRRCSTGARTSEVPLIYALGRGLRRAARSSARSGAARRRSTSTATRSSCSTRTCASALPSADRAGRGLALLQRLRAERGAQGPHGLGRLALLSTSSSAAAR